MMTPQVVGEPSATGRRRSLNGLAIQLSAVALSFILVSLLIVTSSRAAFTAQNSDTNNQVASANIQLADNDANGSMFNVTNAIPGQTYDRCITVTYTGSAGFTPTPVRLYANQIPSGGLAPYLNLSVDMGPAIPAAFSGTDSTGCAGFTGTPTNVYSGTLSVFTTNRTNYTNGVTTWSPGSNGDARTFRFRVTVTDTDAAKNQSAQLFGFQWETQSS